MVLLGRNPKFRIILLAILLVQSITLSAQEIGHVLEGLEDMIEEMDVEEEKEAKRSPQPNHGDEAFYESSTLEQAEADDAEWKELIGDKDYTEEDSFQAEQNKKPIIENIDFDPVFWRWFVILLIAGVFIYLLTRFAQVDRNFNQTINGLDLKELEHAEQNIQESDLDRLLRIALEAKDYRSALRVRYLMVLKSLDANEYIQHKADKTNLNYIIEMKGRPEQKEFMELSRIFEYVWYGEIDIPAEDDQLFAKEFGTYLNTLNGER